MAINRALLTILGFSGLAYGLMGLLIHWFSPIPEVTLLINHSYCPEAQWQQVAQTYSALYRQHQHHQLRIKQVILVNPLTITILPELPPPTTIQQLSTYGQVDPSQQQKLHQSFPQAQILNCQR